MITKVVHFTREVFLLGVGDNPLDNLNGDPR
jgi:hypothetical protein